MPNIELRFANGEICTLSSESDETILEAAERTGIKLAHSCDAGECQTCIGRIITGEITYAEYYNPVLSDSEIANGAVLNCIAVPRADVVLELPYSRVDVLPTQTSTADVIDVTPVCESVVRLMCRISSPGGLTFLAGQYVNITVPGTQETRSYSMANGPSEKLDLEFLIRIIPGGEMSNYLRIDAAIGQELTIKGPYGVFHRRDASVPIIMVAGGTGLAPMLSMLRDLIATGQSSQHILLCFGVTKPADLFYLSELKTIGASLPSLQTRIAIAEPEVNWAGTKGFVTTLLSDEDASTFRKGNGIAYLCGPPPMVETARAWFCAQGIDEAQVCAEQFLPSSAPAT